VRTRSRDPSLMLLHDGKMPGQEAGSRKPRAVQSIDCNSFPGLNRTALPGGMDTSAPVRGLRPIPVLRGRTLKTPNPRNSMRSPDDSARFMLSKTVSTACSALVLVMPVLVTTSLMMSSLITHRLRECGASAYCIRGLRWKSGCGGACNFHLAFPLFRHIQRLLRVSFAITI